MENKIQLNHTIIALASILAQQPLLYLYFKTCFGLLQFKHKTMEPCFSLRNLILQVTASVSVLTQYHGSC